MCAVKSCTPWDEVDKTNCLASDMGGGVSAAS